MTTLSIIPNNSAFMIANAGKSMTVLLNDFKILIDATIAFFCTKHIDSHESFYEMCNDCLDNGYPLLIKIDFYLKLLQDNDENQGNKFRYTECLHIFKECCDIRSFCENICKFINDDNIVKHHEILDKAKITRHSPNKILITD